MILKNKKSIEKIISRDLPLIGMYADHLGLTTGQKKWLGWGYSDLIFYFHDGYADLMLPPQEFYDDFLRHIIKKIDKDRTWFPAEYSRFLKMTKEFSRFFSDSRNELKGKISGTNLKMIYQNFSKWMGKYYAPFVMMKWFPIFIENDRLLNKKYRREINWAIAGRKKAEKILPQGRDLTDLLLSKVKENFAFDKDLVKFLTKKDFYNFAENHKLPGISELKKRKSGFIFSGKGIFLTNGKAETAKKILARLGYNYKIIQTDTNKFGGQSACGGKVSGIVRVIMVRDEISNIKKGEILVTSMTTPEYLPAMRKAAAFITDEGGITCHAAIVAREMKKPCIIGTKVATKVLHSGNYVEIDANKGIIKIS